MPVKDSFSQSIKRLRVDTYEREGKTVAYSCKKCYVK